MRNRKTTGSWLAFAVLGLATSPLAFAAGEPCDPNVSTGRGPACVKHSLTMQQPYVFVKAPQVYFYSTGGVQRGWLSSSSSTGTWRIRIMKWSSLGPDEDHNHFHQVAISDLNASGPTQEISFFGDSGFYRHEIECENDCSGKPFTYFISAP